jgi:hypothetical protein
VGALQNHFVRGADFQCRSIPVRGFLVCRSPGLFADIILDLHTLLCMATERACGTERRNGSSRAASSAIEYGAASGVYFTREGARACDDTSSFNPDCTSFIMATLLLAPIVGKAMLRVRPLPATQNLNTEEQKESLERSCMDQEKFFEHRSSA